MSKKPVPGALAPSDHASYDRKMFWYLRWFFAILIGLSLLTILVAGIVGFLGTSNPSYLSLISTTVLSLPLIRYLVPMDERRFQLEMRKIEANQRRIRGRKTHQRVRKLPKMRP